MIKNLTTNQILLIVLATVLLLLAAFSFFLLQDPYAPLPFAPSSPTSTSTPLPPSPSYTPRPSSTSLPTRQTSYTPFASPVAAGSATSVESTNIPATFSPVPGSGTPIEGTATIVAASPYPIITSTARSPAITSTVQPSSTASPPYPGPVVTSASPTVTQTLSPGEYEVTGRVVQNGTPVPNVIVEFADDDPPRNRTTNLNGNYSFITLAPGTTFTLAFAQADNLQLTPIAEIASQAWIEGTLPTGINKIELPDLDISLNVEGMVFRLVTPVDGAVFSAAVIGPSNPLQFIWAFYYQGDSFYIELGPNGSDSPIWLSDDTTSTSMMWNGTLDDGSHIPAGTYWWRVAVKKTLGNYSMIVYTQAWDLIFNP